LIIDFGKIKDFGEGRDVLALREYVCGKRF
jgi:hypothetical protein